MKALAELQTIGRILSLAYRPFGAESLRASLERDPVAWEQVAALASRHLVTPALYTALMAVKPTDYVPADCLEYLGAVHRLNSRRNRRVLGELSRVARILNQLGIEPVLLKGVANLVDQLYPSQGDRVVSDIDLLVPEQDLRKAFDALIGEGYERGHGVTPNKDVVGRTHHHATPLRHPKVGLMIELHRWIYRASRPDASRESVQIHGFPFKARLFTPTVRLADCILHAQRSHSHYREALPSLRALWDCALLANALSAEAKAALESSFHASGLTRFFADFVEWGALLMPDFPLRSSVASPLCHRARKALCLNLPGYDMAEQLLLQPYSKIAGLLVVVQDGGLTWGEVPVEALRRLVSADWWSRTRHSFQRRRRSLGL